MTFLNILPVLLLLPLRLCGQLNYAGGLVMQSFDSLPVSETFDYTDHGVAKGPALLTQAPVMAAGAAGWGIHARVGTQLLFQVGNGSTGTAAVYPFGHPASRDRALGSLAGGGHSASLGLSLVNQTGRTLSQFTISFFAEQWRNGGTASLTGLKGEYRVATGGGMDSGTFKAVAAMDVPVLSAVPGVAFSMNGNSPACRTECSATVTGLSWAAGQMLILRWRDLDETGADNGLALDDVVFFAPSTSLSPQVAAVDPASDGTAVWGLRPVVVTFNQPVTPGAAWFELRGSVSGVIEASVSHAGPMRYTLTPLKPWPAGETVTVRIFGSQVMNDLAQTMAADHGSAFETLHGPELLTRISFVQGRDGCSPLAGAVVKVRGVVTADFQGGSPALGGFFIQSFPGDEDEDPGTSEGLWIADRGSAASVPVSAGDAVSVTGVVSESGGLTQLVSVSGMSVEGSAEMPEPQALGLPMASGVSFEAHEGMLVRFSQELSVTSTSSISGGLDNYARYGELALAAGAPLVVPTEFMDPNDLPASGTTAAGRGNAAAVHDYERQMVRYVITLDDASTAQFPDPTPFLNSRGTRRCGDTVTGLTGVMTFGNGGYKVLPAGPVPFVDANPRPDIPPAVSGRLRVAGMNMHNYFTTFGGASDRGAAGPEEFQRQKDKVVTALASLDAHVLGLMEVQNRAETVNDLLAALNAAVDERYALVPDPPGGYPGAGAAADHIRCLLLYRPSRLSLAGDCRMDTDAAWYSPGAAPLPLRFPLAQTFVERESGEKFTLCVNHWKSKSSSGATGVDQDQNDGQSAYNDLRRRQAARLSAWLRELAAESGEPDQMILGDLNSYGEEDPLDVLRAGGWQDQGQRFHGIQEYSYLINGRRGRLDHLFATGSMAAQITGQEHWHINADEPEFYDYRLSNKSPAQKLLNVGSPFRSSDHDPVLAGVSLSVPEMDYDAWRLARDWKGNPDAAAQDDPDGDGLANLAEFAMNLDPLLAGHDLMPRGFLAKDQCLFEFRRHRQARGVALIPEWSTDLFQWHEMPGMEVVEALDARTERMRSRLPLQGLNRVLLRLRIVLIAP
jgi:predicted extracellular nuclease